MNSNSPEMLCAILLIIAVLFFIAGFNIGKTEGYRNGYLSAYEHIRNEIVKYMETRE
jgi:hypothetical protein